MEAKELKIECPCCRAKLIIDSVNGGIIQFTAHKEAPISLESFLQGDKTRKDDLEQKFADAKSKEDSKMDLLNKKFEWAKKNKDKLPEAKPGIIWD